MHENYHAAIKANPAIREDGINRIKNKYKRNEAGLRQLIKTYAELYAMSDEQVSDNYILEEILCDAHAGIDVFTTTKRGGLKTVDLSKQANKALETGKKSWSESAGTKASRENNAKKEEKHEKEDDREGLYRRDQRTDGRRADRKGDSGDGKADVSKISYSTLTRKNQGKVRKEVLKALRADEWAANEMIQDLGLVERVFDMISSGKKPSKLMRVFPDIYNAVIRGTVEGIDLTEGDGTARWTPERIESLYRAYGAKESGNQDYAKAYAVMLSPSDFLSLTATAEDMTVIELDAASEDRYNRGEIDENVLRATKEAPFLVVDMETGQVEGHEGRHRMSLLSNAGVDSVPIVVIPYSQTESQKHHTSMIQSLTLTGQKWFYGSAPGVVEVNDVTPFSNRYRAEISEKYGGEAQVKFSRDANDDYNAVVRENKRLKERVEYWKGQTKLTTEPTARQTDTDKAAKDLTKAYASTADVSGVSSDLKALTEYVMRGGDELSWDVVKGKATSIARDIVSNAETLRDEDVDLYRDVRGELKRPLVISEKDAHDVSPEWGKWRNANIGKVNVSVNGRGSVYQARSAKQVNDPNIITSADIKKLQAKGYDGIRWDFGNSTEISVFSPEQVKRTDNKNPTINQDSRYSREAVDNEVNTSMSMEQARDMIQRAFVLGWIKE